jgi:hypothetical protein
LIPLGDTKLNNPASTPDIRKSPEKLGKSLFDFPTSQSHPWHIPILDRSCRSESQSDEQAKPTLELLNDASRREQALNMQMESLQNRLSLENRQYYNAVKRE